MTTATSHPTIRTDTTTLPAPTLGQLHELAVVAAAEAAVRAEADPAGDAHLRSVHRVLDELVGTAPAGAAVVGDHRVVVAREVAVLLRRLGRRSELAPTARRRAFAELAAVATSPAIR